MFFVSKSSSSGFDLMSVSMWIWFLCENGNSSQFFHLYIFKHHLFNNIHYLNHRINEFYHCLNHCWKFLLNFVCWNCTYQIFLWFIHIFLFCICFRTIYCCGFRSCILCINSFQSYWGRNLTEILEWIHDYHQHQ